MAFDGSGTFNRPVSSYVFDTVISETDVNTEMDGIATGLSNCITKDGQQTLSANIPFSGFKITGYGSSQTPSARADVPQLGQVQDGSFVWCGTAGGTADAITLTPSPAITAYAAGQKFRWIAGASNNTGAMTIAVSGLATKAAQNDGSALVADDHAAGKMYEGIYDGTAFQITRVRALAVGTSGAKVPLLNAANTWSATQTHTKSVDLAKGADIASAATTNIWATDGNTVHVTGTTGITSFGTAPQAGARRKVIFDGALVLTHDAAGLILPGGANITTAAGDIAEVIADTTTKHRVVFQKANGKAVVSSAIAPSPITASLSADVLLNNTSTFFDGPSIAQGSTGTWFVSGTVTLVDTAGFGSFSVKLWDGTTVIASAVATSLSLNNPVAVSLSGYIASPAGNLRISAKDASSTSGKILSSATGLSKDSTITAIRLL